MIYKTIPLKNVAKTEGTYFVGTQNFQVIDSSRVMWFTDNIKGPRKLSVKIWYPVDNIGSFSKAPYFNQHKIIGRSISKIFGTNRSSKSIVMIPLFLTLLTISFAIIIYIFCNPLSLVNPAGEKI